MIILWTILIIIGGLGLICLVRALMLKPTVDVNFCMEPLKAPEDETGRKRMEKYAAHISKLIQIPTVSAKENQDMAPVWEFHKVLETMFPNIHRVCEKHEFSGSLLFHWKGTKHDKPILFMSHHDVVSAKGEWSHPPFSGEIYEGRLWGRGSIDTKTGLYCMLQAVEEMIEAGYQPSQDVYIASSCTEEVSGQGAPLTVSYLKSRGVRLRFVIDEGNTIMDHPFMGVAGTYAVMGVMEKGYGDVKFTARGRGGHASTPPKHSPLVRLGAFMSQMDQHPPFKKQLHPMILEMFRRMAPNMKLWMRLVFANLWLFKPVLTLLMPLLGANGAAIVRTTLAFTMAQGSAGYNVLPQEAYVTGNMRFSPHQGSGASIEAVKKAAQKYDIETEVLFEGQPTKATDINGEAAKAATEVIQALYPGIGVLPFMMTGCTDARFYEEICDQVLRFTPIYVDRDQPKTVHGIDENVYISVLPKAVDFYKGMIQK